MSKRMKRLGISFLASFFAIGSVPFGEGDVYAEERADALSDNRTAAPEPWGALPSLNQYQYQKEELAAFCHFGPNTFENVEWGEHYGDRAPSDIFRLENDFDADRMVKAMKDAGFKKLIITAKHHDGFCLWNSAETDYDVAAAGYKNGEGDVLAEISAACTKYDLNMGLYLSPWDIHEPSYGYYDANGNPTSKENDVLDYNEFYNNQLEEILGSDKYGNDGHFVEVWMDGAKGSGANAQEYDFQLWFDTIQRNEGKAGGYEDDCMLFGAEAYTTVRWIGNELGLANEETWSKSQVDYEANTIDSNRTGSNGTTVGIAEGNQWTVPEADARITSGWFWGPGKKTPKSLKELSDMYFNSVGHNAVLLLNIPPNTEGTVDEDILNRMAEFGANIKNSFADNLAKDAEVTASEVRGNDVAFAPSNVLDGSDETYWTMEDGTTTGSLTLNLGEAKRFDMVTIEEAILLGQRVKSFEVDYQANGGEWKEFARGTTIGAKRICRTKPVLADKIRIRITGSYAVPLISEVGVYKATKAFEEPSPVPDGMEKILISDTDDSDGSGFTFSGTWKNETGSQFIDGVGTWANSGATASLKFTGHKVWVFGTKDPSHGTADIYIDGTKVDVMDTKASVRKTGQMIYESPDLESGEHILEIRTTGTVGLNLAAVLNNDEKGAVQFEKQSLTMEEDTVESVVVKRIGGSKGRITAMYENNPGSAVQGNYDVDGIQGTIVFEDGETEKIIPVTTKRDVGIKGDLTFTVDLIGAADGGLLGFNISLPVTIRDLDDPERMAEAASLFEECEGLDFDRYANRESEKKAVMQWTKSLKECLEQQEVDKKAVFFAMRQLQEAKEKLTETYSEKNPFLLPEGTQKKKVEAESFILDSSGAKDATKYVRITERETASNGKEVNWFEEGNRIYLPFIAPKEGNYKITATYRSGREESNPNAFEWSGSSLVSGSLDVWGETNGTQFHTEEFEISVNQAGKGELIFTASGKGGPVIDKFEIECTDKTVEEVAVTGVEFDEEELVLTDEHAFLGATVLPFNATNKNVTFESSNPFVASVAGDGCVAMITGLKNGETTITVTTEDGQKTDACRVIVERYEFAKQDLTESVSEAEIFVSLGEENYTEETWLPFKAAYEKALAAAKNGTTQDMISFLEKLQKAMAELKEVEKDPGEYPDKNPDKDPDKDTNKDPGANPDKTQTVPLGVPANVKAVSKMEGVKVSFSPVLHASSYVIYRKAGNAALVKLAEVLNTTYMDVKPLAGKTSTYTVVAVSKDASYTDSAASAGASVAIPKTVTKFKAKAVKGGAKISFKKVKGAKNYIILRAAKKNGAYKKIKTLKAKQTSFTDKKAKKGKNYYKVITKAAGAYSPATKAQQVKVKK